MTSTEHATMTFDEAAGQTRTGDVWLFRGTSTADRAIRAFTNSPVNHVGMVIALDDLPPLCGTPNSVARSLTCGRG